MKSTDTARPNIILILADDMGYSDLSCYGSEIQTPHIDALAASGIRFTQMYNSARCCPSRASLLTGLHPHQTGVGHMIVDLGHPAYQGYLNDNSVTIAEVLRESGYATLMTGKWHVGGFYPLADPASWTPGDQRHPTPISRGFDKFYGILDGVSSYFHPHTLMDDDQLIATHGDFYLTDAITDRSLSLIEAHGRKEHPFFLYVAYTAPHWPLHALSEDIACFEQTYYNGWDQHRMDRYERMIELGIIDRKWPMSPRDQDAPPWSDIRDKEWEARRMAVYAAQIYSMDRGVGTIMEKLRALDIADNTLVLFLSDNGGCAEFMAEDGYVAKKQIWPMRNGGYPRVGNHRDLLPGGEETYMSYDLPWANLSNTPFRRFKHWVHEGGVATPFIASWPAHAPRNTLFHEPVHITDIMATCVELGAARYPDIHHGCRIHPLEGESLAEILYGKPWSRQQPICLEHEGNCSIRRDNWKLVKKFGSDWELYNMEKDRTELDNVIEKNRSRARQLRKEYHAWLQRCGIVSWQSLMRYYPAGKNAPTKPPE